MKLNLLFVIGATAVSLCALAQPTREPMQVDRDPAVVKDQMQVDRDPAVSNEPQKRSEESSASGGSSAAPKSGPSGEQPPAKPKEGGKDKHDAPTGETNKN